jgi:hypothetical protein
VPSLNRHVAQRNVSVVSTAAMSKSLLMSLSAVHLGHKLQLIQLAPKEGEVAAKIAAPHAKLDTDVVTHVLGEIDQHNHVTLDHAHVAPAGGLAPFHPLIHGGAPAAPEVHAVGTPAVVNAARLVHGLPADHQNLKVATLLNSVAALHRGSLVLPNPIAGQVQVVRLVNYDPRGQLIGGYTIVLATQ